MVLLPYPKQNSGVSSIYPEGPFWECPVYTLFAFHGGRRMAVSFRAGPRLVSLNGLAVASSGAKQLSCIYTICDLERGRAREG